LDSLTDQLIDELKLRKMSHRRGAENAEDFFFCCDFLRGKITTTNQPAAQNK
jgi:hypothetical protein